MLSMEFVLFFCFCSALINLMERISRLKSYFSYLFIVITKKPGQQKMAILFCHFRGISSATKRLKLNFSRTSRQPSKLAKPDPHKMHRWSGCFLVKALKLHQLSFQTLFKLTNLRSLAKQSLSKFGESSGNGWDFWTLLEIWDKFP